MGVGGSKMLEPVWKLDCGNGEHQVDGDEVHSECLKACCGVSPVVTQVMSFYVAAWRTDSFTRARR